MELIEPGNLTQPSLESTGRLGAQFLIVSHDTISEGQFLV